MRHEASGSREPLRSRASRADPSAGERAAALSPPGYGIDFVDRGGGRPLPVQLRAGIESLSGFDMSGVRVHSGSALPSRLGALAYARGPEIHLGPGQERHLPHEAWHVVQQAQNRVAPTIQAKGGVGINDDAHLEREADEMGARAMATKASAPSVDAPRDAPATGGAVVQRVRGGIEFTEDSPAELHSHPGPQPAAANVARSDLWEIGGAEVSVFTVPKVDSLQDRHNYDHTLLVSGEVKLTNDVVSAEWVVTRHKEELTARVMKTRLTSDVEQMFEMRRALADKVDAHKAANPGVTVLAPGKLDTLADVDAEGLFVYRPGTSKGKAQVTAQYSKLETIKRINLLNASKFVKGSKVAEGEDVARVSGTESNALKESDLAKTTSFARAGDLLDGLIEDSYDVDDVYTGDIVLTTDQVGLIKLMVLNDALATTMVRYDAAVGQAQEKNLQRFFPKARRDEYVKAVAGAVLSDENLDSLRAELQRTATRDAQRFYDEADAGALRVDEAFSALPKKDKRFERMHLARRALLEKGVAPPAQKELKMIKDVVLGPNGSLLEQWISVAAEAYTDATADAADHWSGGKSKVLVSSAGFTPVADNTIGAIYEFREREIAAEEPRWFKVGSISELKSAIDKLFTASA